MSHIKNRININIMQCTFCIHCIKGKYYTEAVCSVSDFVFWYMLVYKGTIYKENINSAKCNKQSRHEKFHYNG